MDLPKLSKTVLDENFHCQFHGLKLSLNNTVHCIGPYETKKKVSINLEILTLGVRVQVGVPRWE